MPQWPRIIVHADMDAFYAAIEQLDRPELRGRPVLVGHPGGRGVVSTASYEARPFGVGSAMSMALALARCPQAIVVPPRFARYQEVSQQVMEVFAQHSPYVEPLSLDEAFLDMSGSEQLFGPPEAMGARIKAAVLARTGLHVSVGVAATKYVAKVASDHHKPNGLVVVPPEHVQPFLDPLPVRRLWGVGAKAEQQLHARGLTTIAQVRQAAPAWLEAELGALGRHIHALAQGLDPRQVQPWRQAKSIGHEETLEHDLRARQHAEPVLLRAADVVARRLRAGGLTATGVRLKLKTASFVLITRQRQMSEPTTHAGTLYHAALDLLAQSPWPEPMRLVGLAAFALQARPPMQGDLFTHGAALRRDRLDTTLDAVNQRFGSAVIRRASELDPPPRR